MGVSKADYLDVTFDLENDIYKPFIKPNNSPTYINVKSNHPPNILKQIPQIISKRISDNSSSEQIFNQSKPMYDKLLRNSGYKEGIKYNHKINSTGNKKAIRKRNITWYNPPYSVNVQTNLGHIFLKLIDKHFKNSKLNKIFNRNNVKVSYSCMPNIKQIIKGHNKKLTCQTNQEQNTPAGCNCRGQCPLNGQCLTPNIVYLAEVKTLDKQQNTNPEINKGSNNCNSGSNNTNRRSTKM